MEKEQEDKVIDWFIKKASISEFTKLDNSEFKSKFNNIDLKTRSNIFENAEHKYKLIDSSKTNGDGYYNNLYKLTDLGVIVKNKGSWLNYKKEVIKSEKLIKKKDDLEIDNLELKNKDLRNKILYGVIGFISAIIIQNSKEILKFLKELFLK